MAVGVLVAAVVSIMALGDHTRENPWTDQGVGWAYLLLFVSLVYIVIAIPLGIGGLLYGLIRRLRQPPAQ